MLSSNGSDKSMSSSSSGEGESDKSPSLIEEEKSGSSSVKSMSISCSQDMKSSQNKSKSDVTMKEDNEEFQISLISNSELSEKILKEDGNNTGIAMMQSLKAYGPPQTLAQSNYSDIANSIPKVECEILEGESSKFQKIISKEDNSKSLVIIKDDKTPTFNLFFEAEDKAYRSYRLDEELEKYKENEKYLVEQEEKENVFWSDGRNMKNGNLMAKLFKIQERITSINIYKHYFKEHVIERLEKFVEKTSIPNLDEQDNSNQIDRAIPKNAVVIKNNDLSGVVIDFLAESEIIKKIAGDLYKIYQTQTKSGSFDSKIYKISFRHIDANMEAFHHVSNIVSKFEMIEATFIFESDW
jgi:hypothetical protein